MMEPVMEFSQHLSSKLYEFYKSKTLCDTLLMVESDSNKHSMWAHSVVLAATSADLCAQFTNQTDALSSNTAIRFCLTLSDCDPTAVDIVLRFVYTGMLVAPMSFRHFHKTKQMTKIVDVCKALGVPLSKLNGILLKFDRHIVDISSPKKKYQRVRKKHSKTNAVSDLHCPQLEPVSSDIIKSEIADQSDVEFDDTSLVETATDDIDLSKMDTLFESTKVETLLEPTTDSKCFKLNMSMTSCDKTDGSKCRKQKQKSLSSSADLRRSTRSAVCCKPKQKRPRRSLTVRRDRKTGTCSRCGVTLTPWWKVFQHQLTECSQRRFVSCEICGKTFNSTMLYRMHMQQVHAITISPNCRKYPTITSSQAAQQQQQVPDSLPNSDRPYVCDTCGKSFRRPANLVEHMNVIHNSETRSHLCDLCGMSFGSYGRLQRHVMVHKRPYACSRCQKHFSQKHILEEHLRSCQTGEKTFVCDVCGARFTFKTNLGRHKWSHRESNSCVECGRVYKLKHSLDEHIRYCHTPAAANSSKCSICDKVFARPKYLIQHMKQHAKIVANGNNNGVPPLEAK